MKIICVSAFYSEGMGYCENSLPKALAALGHEVHLITSNLNVYGNELMYSKTYESFLGPADQGTGRFKIDGYTVHRLQSKILFGYVYPKGLVRMIKKLSPDVVHSFEIASLLTYMLAALKPFNKFRLFTETHQHLSIVKPYLKNPYGNIFKVLFYKLTRTLPTYLSSFFVEKCYAISPDCAFVANKYFGVPEKKILVQTIGTDTDLFSPAISDTELSIRKRLRKKLGYNDDDIVCVYSGRFAADKNPLLLALAIKKLELSHPQFKALFIGDGEQLNEILACPNVKVIPFMKHKDLSNFYCLSDIAVWPTQESISMLDAASCELPLIVSDKIGTIDRIKDSGKTYTEGNVEDLSMVIISFLEKKIRIQFGEIGREKMMKKYSWKNIAERYLTEYKTILGK
jgi:glycosyltransferase involved in cell wall biosynthesis